MSRLMTAAPRGGGGRKNPGWKKPRGKVAWRWPQRSREEWLRGVANVLGWGYFGSILLLLLLLYWISESWWGGTILTYMPRSVFLVPGFVVSAFCGMIAWRSVVPCAIGMVLVLGPLMGLHGNPLRMFSTPAPVENELRVVSCNVQGFRPRFAEVVAEISAIKPDVVVFQEAYDDHPLTKTFFGDWNVIREENHFAASKYPMKLIGVCHPEAFDRVTAIRLEVQTPGGIVHVYSVHQTSQRETLTEVRPWSLITGEGVEELATETMLRDVEGVETRNFINEGNPEFPAIYAGDFNMTRESSLYQRHWGDLANASDTGGWGYGYTGLCQTRRFWPAGWPWVKVDHVLMTPHWEGVECRPGTSNGSDHRLIHARLKRVIQ